VRRERGFRLRRNAFDPSQLVDRPDFDGAVGQLVADGQRVEAMSERLVVPPDLPMRSPTTSEMARGLPVLLGSLGEIAASFIDSADHVERLGAS
jgi:hypothetical protein